MAVHDLPTLNAGLNALCFCLLLIGYRSVRSGRTEAHRWWMTAALGCAVLFLISYLVYHARVGSVPYPHHDWTRWVYFGILVPHVILAAVNVPFIVLLVYRAFAGRFEAHRRLAKWVWPSWAFVSISGVIIYLMLYHELLAPRGSGGISG